MSLAALGDVVGPIARCVRDAALTLDALAGYSPEDSKTIAGVGHRPPGGYASLLSIAAREAYLAIFGEVFARERLDAPVFPQMRDSLGPPHGIATIHEAVVSEINIAGLPALTVPAGYYGLGAPFGLVFVGPMWSKATLLACAHDYERATRRGRAPMLVTS
jgi:Asp-tRNA(Asn)/Glu-tRNA(Gln) amidotransferase A subunit family amidase